MWETILFNPVEALFLSVVVSTVLVYAVVLVWRVARYVFREILELGSSERVLGPLEQKLQNAIDYRRELESELSYMPEDWPEREVVSTYLEIAKEREEKARMDIREDSARKRDERARKMLDL